MRELSLHILDVMENAREAGATRVELNIKEELNADRLTVVVRDNGWGMDPETARRALKPFFTTRATGHGGLGLPLFCAAARQCGGDLTLESAPGRGTTVMATLPYSHPGRAPLGNMTDSLIAFLLAGPHGVSGREEKAVDLEYHHQVNDRTFEFDTAVIRAELDEIPLSYPLVREWLRRFITQEEAELASQGERNCAKDQKY
jgi:hypothetical protein